MLHQVCAPYAKGLELGAVYATLDPLMHGLTCYRWIDELAGFFHAVVIANLTVAGMPFAT